MASLHSQTPAAAVQVEQEVGVAWKFLLGPQTCPFQDTSRTATAGSSSLDQPQTKPWAGPPSQSIPCWCSPLMCLKHHLVLSMVIVTQELASLLFGSQEKNWHFKAFAPIQRFITCQREKKIYSMAFFVLWWSFQVSQLKGKSVGFCLLGAFEDSFQEIHHYSGVSH